MKNDLQQQSQRQKERYIINKTQRGKIIQNKTNIYPLNCQQLLRTWRRTGTIENSSFADRMIHSRNCVR